VALKEVAEEKKTSIAGLVTRIDASRGKGGLSSAVRVWLLEHYRERAWQKHG
jgi:predicted DNA-binding ribbon-helix-helix protein